MTDEEKKEIVSLVISEIESRGIKVEETTEAADASAVQTLLGVNADEAMVRIAVDKVGATAEQVTQIETNRANIENLATTVAENTETLQRKQDALGDTTILTINDTPLALGGRITIEGGSGGNIEVDDKLNASSTNPVENKVVTAEIAAAIEEGRKQALHALFKAAGALYNDTDEVIIRTFDTYGATHSDTDTFEFEHQPGCWYLNGVGDITDDEMISIYNAPHNMFVAGAYAPFTNAKYRAFPFYGNGLSVAYKGSLEGLFASTKIEKLSFYTPDMESALYCSGATLTNMFYNCQKLTHIIGRFYVGSCTLTNMFYRCYALQEFRMRRLNKDLSLSDSPSISKNSLLFLINDSTATSAITITLHADVYNKCVEGGEWYDEVEAAFVAKYGEGTRYIALQSA